MVGGLDWGVQVLDSGGPKAIKALVGFMMMELRQRNGG